MSFLFRNLQRIERESLDLEIADIFPGVYLTLNEDTNWATLRA